MTDQHADTTVDEIADGIYRISTPVDAVPGGFTFNQFLIKDEQPLLFHTGLRALFPAVSAAVARVIPLETLRYVAFSHVEADECGSLNQFLAAAPQAEPVCSQIAAMVSVNDLADRPARALADGETLSLGARTVEWYDTPHLPHGWECGYLGETTTGTLFCGDLFTQPGAGMSAVTEEDVLGPSEAMRASMDYFSHTKHADALIKRLAGTKPTTLACMHGSSWRGDGEQLLLALGEALSA
jgi:flavorubredoxin